MGAGLRLLASQKDDQTQEKNISCDICSYKASSDSELLGHQAGVRHQENARTKAALEAAGFDWKVHHATQPDPPVYSVVGNSSWSCGETWSHDPGYGGKPRRDHWDQPPPLMAMPVPPPMMPPWEPDREEPCLPDPIPWEAKERDLLPIQFTALRVGHGCPLLPSSSTTTA